MKLAFRRWAKPTVRAGGTLRTAAGVLAIDSIERVDLDTVSAGDVQAAGYVSREELARDLRPEGALYRIAFHVAGKDPRENLRENDTLDPGEIAALKGALAKLDRKGEWTSAALCMIAERDGRTAAEIAERLDMEKLTLKRKIRQLKELGLTESLAVGYRLSPRGHAFVNGSR
ncbi:helix-turn-helix domain-containing protein [Sinorhizobium sp. RAC02]|uniref:helix-turn-helix domain-containing protein n=1 Tax=Sinorhizobium sp. RAC02 TaxID=1842534 RepID=UPI0025710FE7|nr:helix-turn-helix domain-containing protein [Sinorhizobium sp. RAC02]